MTEMNISLKHNHRLVVASVGRGGQERDVTGAQSQQIQAIINGMDKQKSSTVQHKELYSVSYDKPEKNIKKYMCVCVCVCVCVHTYMYN